MSKPVEVFKISKESVVVADHMRGIERHTIVADTELGLLFDRDREITVDRTVIPIQRMVTMRPGARFEQWIAVEPELKELLTIEERQEIDRLNQLNKDLESAVDHQSDVAVRWWSQPWYKRVWSALRGAGL